MWTEKFLPSRRNYCSYLFDGAAVNHVAAKLKYDVYSMPARVLRYDRVPRVASFFNIARSQRRSEEKVQVSENRWMFGRRDISRETEEGFRGSCVNWFLLQLKIEGLACLAFSCRLVKKRYVCMDG